MGTSLCSASPVSEPNLPPDSTNQPTFLLPNLIRHPTELFSFNFLSQKNIQNLRSKMASRCRQNYHEECEAAINKQINMELFASYSYTALASHFARDDVHLKGFAKFFKESSNEERDHAGKFMSYQSLRVVELSFNPSTGQLLMSGKLLWLLWSMSLSLRKKLTRHCWRSMPWPAPTMILI